MPTDTERTADHAHWLASYLARDVSERDYREHAKALERAIGRERYREAHSLALQAIGRSYVESHA